MTNRWIAGSVSIVIFFLVLGYPSAAIAENRPVEVVPAVTAEAAVVMDLDTGEVLYGKCEHERRPPASLTKVMTGYLIARQADLQQVVTVSENAAATEESSLNLKADDKLTIDNLLHGALMKSANDACVAMAEQVAGSEAQFVQRMNLQACLLGCSNTNFQNSNGLPAEQHYSSAYDLAVMTRAAMQENIFAQIVQEQQYQVRWQDDRQLLVRNTNRLLREYPGAIGVKTGTTNEAGQCLIAVAQKAGKRIIVVVLKSKNRFYDAVALLDYGLSVERKSSILNSGEAEKAERNAENHADQNAGQWKASA